MKNEPHLKHRANRHACRIRKKSTQIKPLKVKFNGMRNIHVTKTVWGRGKKQSRNDSITNVPCNESNEKTEVRLNQRCYREKSCHSLAIVLFKYLAITFNGKCVLSENLHERNCQLVIPLQKSLVHSANVTLFSIPQSSKIVLQSLATSCKAVHWNYKINWIFSIMFLFSVAMRWLLA